ncbi:hypothetical protein LOC68_13290 [Blastopirellula sp. JC732]|uniref:SMI1/KNR4 family protein n=1 Tax=Blastopirellula sediminis TaxID=2894196 RepID=A0A9X1MND1_9BACT|nr:hypothetical protein [Blastopirellula sediminis]MCC9607337.1 hypothetical protein [Blastopirellula sediminis]MCC9629370.1 hypothetical protein [Blastopirellula sediminis]
MGRNYEAAIAGLRDAGWDVQETAVDRPLPDFFLARYPWLPSDIRQFIAGTIRVVSPDETSWFMTSAELAGDSGSAFLWNQWELDSLEVAAEDADWRQSIVEFWDNHCPLILSVKNGYAHLSVRKRDLAIVAGGEPEYEEVAVVADSLDALRQKITQRDEAISLYV